MDQEDIMDQQQRAVSVLRRKLEEDKLSSKFEIERATIENATSEFDQLEINLLAAINEKEAINLYHQNYRTAAQGKAQVGRAKIAEQAETIRELKMKLSDAEMKNSQFEKDLRSMAESSLIKEEKSEKEVSDVRKQNSKLQKKITEKDKAIKEAEADVVRLTGKNDQLSNQNSELEVMLKKREEELKSSEEMFQQNAATKLIIQNLETELETKEDEIRTFKDNWRAIEEELKSSKKEIYQFKKAMDSRNQVVKQLQETEVDLKTKLEVKEDEIKTFKDNWRAIEEELKSSTKEICQFRKAMDSRNEVVKQLQETEVDLKTKLEVKEDEIKTKEGEVKHLMTLAENKLLMLLDSQALKFEECTDDVVKRISNALRELNFAKEWAMRKNKAMLQVRDEMLVYRDKVTELEKIIKDHEDGISLLHEEKREAIRQLCVLIDYYRNMLSQMNRGKRRALTITDICCLR